MSTAHAIADPDRQLTLPLLPQRGLISRAADRGARIERVALKAWRHNVPDSVLDPTFAEQLAAMGVELRVDTETDSPPRWHDFHDIDVALCIRRFHPQYDIDDTYQQKPATKLVNAWCAGVIPLVAPEAAYLDLVADGQDAIIVRDADGIIEALRRLKADPAYVRNLLDRGAVKAVHWKVDAVLDDWQQLLSSPLPRANRITPMLAILATAGTAVRERLSKLGRTGSQPPRM
jgi:hypothetical protein